MSETVSGARRLLALPAAYKLLQVAVGSNASHRRFVAEHVRPSPASRLLDVGCGPGHILRALPADTRYVGIDASAEYIAAAQRRWGDRAEFHHMTVGEAGLSDREFDIVLAMGLLHHLDDAEAASLIGMASEVLVPGGRFLAIDPARAPGQPRVARWLIGRDRGEYVRTADAYAELARESFGSVDVTVRSDLLRVPYTHAVLECAVSEPPGA
jgi:2-polyprenyl-3-methyl-5-hydroxy-6-metoxy-1,4-benzoquinol methylase